MTHSLLRRLAMECFGTALLVGTVVGSGIMAERLSGGNTAIALLANTLATAAILITLIIAFGELSGAHFNPAVSVAVAVRGAFPWGEVIPYVLAQVAGGILGAFVAHIMFSLPVISWSQHARSGPAQFVSEIVATFGLVCIIEMNSTKKVQVVAVSVGLYIAAAYWCTSSTSFANPAVTIARCFSDTFSGIRPTDVPMFIAAQMVGALSAGAFCRWVQQGSAVSQPAND
ncbi:MAG: aquaporin family protein [Acidobacteriota bacterium]|nr:aquaporin family protein [Acidobacteriota bacterium]